MLANLTFANDQPELDSSFELESLGTVACKPYRN